MKLTRAGAIDALFTAFDRQLRERGYLAMGGQIVDATLVTAPKQRNSATEKDAIKAGVFPTPRSCANDAAIGDFNAATASSSGTENDRAKRVTCGVYGPLDLNKSPILFTGRRTELISSPQRVFRDQYQFYQ